MTAGSGIMHQEMPCSNTAGQMHGFQLRANLPSSMRMITPRYQDIQQADIPEIVDDDGTRIRVITGEFWGRKGPVDGIAAEPMYLDVSIVPNVTRSLPVDTYANAFAYVFKGTASFSDSSQPVGIRMEKGIM